MDLKGRLRLPDFLLDDYEECVISLGFGAYLHLMNHVVYVEFNKQAGKGREGLPAMLDEELADIVDRLVGSALYLKQDKVGRITIPMPLLLAAGIAPGGWVIGTRIPIADSRPEHLQGSSGGILSYWRIKSEEPAKN